VTRRDPISGVRVTASYLRRAARHTATTTLDDGRRATRRARRATTRIRDRGYDERDATARRRIDGAIDGDRAID
jgi:hypothetical protein